MNFKRNALLSLFGASLALGVGFAEAKPTVKLVFIGPLTGGVSANGIGGRNSTDLAVRLRNEDPKAKYTYELVSLDDECKPNIAVQVATKAAADNSIIGGVTHYCSVTAVATVETYHKFGLPVVVWGAVLPSITYGNKYGEIHRVNGTMINQNEVAAKVMLPEGYFITSEGKFQAQCAMPGGLLLFISIRVCPLVDRKPMAISKAFRWPFKC